jgi:hypothetical protein
MRNNLEEVRGALHAITNVPGDPSMVGIENLTPDEVNSLTVTLCADMIRYMLLRIANNDRAKAMEGLRVLTRDMNRLLGQ